jgi:multiple sugar transport system permease protein
LLAFDEILDSVGHGSNTVIGVHSVKRKGISIKGIVQTLGLTGYFVFALFPIIWILMMSLKNSRDVIAVPPKFLFQPTLENYQAITIGLDQVTGESLRPDFPDYFLNTIIIASLAVLVSLLLGTFAAYALARFNFRFKEDIAFTFLSFRFAPELMVILPLYMIFQQFHLIDSFLGLTLAYQLVTLPFMIWVLRGFFEELPRDVEQAARLDGYSWWGVFRRIAIPLVKPGIAAIVILSFIMAWNNFIFAMILGGERTQPITLGILGFIGYERILWGQMAAATIICVIPELVLAFFVQKHIIRGLTFGAIKG